LSQGLRVIPILTGDAALPAEADLPQDIAGLSGVPRATVCGVVSRRRGLGWFRDVLRNGWVVLFRRELSWVLKWWFVGMAILWLVVSVGSSSGGWGCRPLGLSLC
jgi:hypothetical protein